MPLILYFYTSKKLITFNGADLLRYTFAPWWYPSRSRALRFFNYIGNKTFCSLFFMSVVSKEKPLETWAIHDSFLNTFGLCRNYTLLSFYSHDKYCKINKINNIKKCVSHGFATRAQEYIQGINAKLPIWEIHASNFLEKNTLVLFVINFWLNCR